MKVELRFHELTDTKPFLDNSSFKSFISSSNMMLRIIEAMKGICVDLPILPKEGMYINIRDFFKYYEFTTEQKAMLLIPATYLIYAVLLEPKNIVAYISVPR